MQAHDFEIAGADIMMLCLEFLFYTILLFKFESYENRNVYKKNLHNELME